MKNPYGIFKIHDADEMDVRGCCNGSMFIFADLLRIAYRVMELHVDPQILASHIQCLMYLMMQCTYYLANIIQNLFFYMQLQYLTKCSLNSILAMFFRMFSQRYLNVFKHF